MQAEAVDIIRAYKRLFSTPDGKVVLNDLKEQFSDRSSIIPGDPYATHAREGAREVYLYIDENITEEVD